MNEYILRVENLTKSYDIVDYGTMLRRKRKFGAVNDISFCVKHGEIVGLIGESGCGKTTVGRIITKLIEPDTGRIIFEGKDITRISNKDFMPLRSKIQMIFQDPGTALNPQLKIKRILMEALYSIGVTNKQEQEKTIAQYITRVGLTDSYLLRYPHELSGGQKQRICILLALLTNPDFLVADEVVSALDLSVQAQILNLLKELQKELKLSMLFISHNLSIVNYMSDRIIVMYRGEIVEIGSCDDIYNNCIHPYTKLLLSSVLDLEEDREPEEALERYNILSDNKTSCVFAKRCPHMSKDCAAVKPKTKQVSESHVVKCHLVD